MGFGERDGSLTTMRLETSPRKRFRPSLKIEHWSETPFRLSSANVRAESLSVPELREYLHFNADFPPTLLAPFRTHFQYRLALPWTCLVVVCIAAPLGIGYSRRGVLSSVAAAVILVFSNELPGASFSRARRRRPRSRMDRRVDAEHSFRRDWSVSALSSRLKSRSAQL